MNKTILSLLTSTRMVGVCFVYVGGSVCCVRVLCLFGTSGPCLHWSSLCSLYMYVDSFPIKVNDKYFEEYYDLVEVRPVAMAMHKHTCCMTVRPGYYSSVVPIQ